MKAPPEAQLTLLELADTDAELARLEHRRRTLPEVAECERLEARGAGLRDESATVEALESDLKRELAKAERDVEQVRTRVDRDQARLDAGQVSSPRELENLQSEIASLAKRQSELEDVVLEVMERAEEAAGRHRALAEEQAALDGTHAEAVKRRDAALAEIAGLEAAAKEQRSGVASGVPADLLTLYDKLRAQHGVGAAALSRGRCEGCHLALNTVDLGNIRAAAPDEVLRCEECRRILVRTPESGL